MPRRMSSFAMVFLVLLGAMHQGVHLLEHFAHHEACPHEVPASCGTSAEHLSHAHEGHSHAGHAPVSESGSPLLADPTHAGHEHYCSVCSTPPSLPSWRAVESAFEGVALEICDTRSSLWAGDWVRDALPPRRGPPASC